MSETTPISTQPIQYAGPLARYGVIVDEREDEVVVVLPPMRWLAFKKLWIWFVLGGVAYMLGAGADLYQGHLHNTALAIAGILTAGVNVIIGLIGLAHNVQFFRERFEFHVTPRELAVQINGPKTKLRPTGVYKMAIPIEHVGNIRGDLYGMGLTIQNVGRDMPEFMPHTSRELRVRIAEILTNGVMRMKAKRAEKENSVVS